MPTATSIPARPTTSAEFAARIAANPDSQLRITGSNSLPLSGFDASRPIADISTLRLSKVLDHSPSDMTVSVQAGITLEALQRQLAWHNQWLPVDPPASNGRIPGQRTIGGLIATNSLGPLRLGCGDWRLLILGMKYIDATGTLLSSGSRTVKNVAGYAAHRLLIGAGGTLGAIAEVTLRTFSRPPDEQCLILFCNSAQQAETLLAAILLSPTTPAYLQLVGGHTFAANPLELPAPPDPRHGMALVVGYLGRPETCAAQIDTIRRLPEAQGIESISQTAAQAGRLRLWMTSEPALDLQANGLAARLFLRSSQVAALLPQIESLAPGTWAVCEAATGILRITIPNASANLHDPVTRLITERGGRLLVTSGNVAPVLPSPTASNGPAARLKHALDPANRFGTCCFL